MYPQAQGEDFMADEVKKRRRDRRLKVAIAGAERAGAVRATVVYFTWAVVVWGLAFILVTAVASVSPTSVRRVAILALRVTVVGILSTVGRALTLDTSIWG